MSNWPFIDNFYPGPFNLLDNFWFITSPFIGPQSSYWNSGVTNSTVTRLLSVTSLPDSLFTFNGVPLDRRYFQINLHLAVATGSVPDSVRILNQDGITLYTVPSFTSKWTNSTTGPQEFRKYNTSISTANTSLSVLVDFGNGGPNTSSISLSGSYDITLKTGFTFAYPKPLNGYGNSLVFEFLGDVTGVGDLVDVGSVPIGGGGPLG